MIVPDSVRKEWLAKRDEIEILSEDLQTTRTQLEKDLQTTKTTLEADLQTTQTELEEALKTEKVKTQQMKEDLQTELEVTKLKLLNTEARLKMVEQTMTSILSKLNV